MNSSLAKFNKGNSNFELGTAICYVNVENYFLTIKYKALGIQGTNGAPFPRLCFTQL